MSERAEPPRLYLVAPQRPDPERFPAELEAALSAGDVAAVLFAVGEPIGAPEKLAAELTATTQARGAAALVFDDTRIAGRLKADGVHIGTGPADLRSAVESFGGKRIIGAGNLVSRHAAMEAGEAGADYVFFGRPHGDTHDEPHPKALDLAEWWSDLMQVPAVVMAGRSLPSLAAAAATGAAFVAVHDAIWAHPHGPAAAIRAAVTALAAQGRRAA